MLELILIVWLAVVTAALIVVLIILCCYCCSKDKEQADRKAYRRYMAENPYENSLVAKNATTKTAKDAGPNGGAIYGTTNGHQDDSDPDNLLHAGAATPAQGYASSTGFDNPAADANTFDQGDDWKQSLREDVFTEFAVDTIERGTKRGPKSSSQSSAQFLGY